MLTIRADQMEVFDQRALVEYQWSLLDLLRNGNYPEVDELSDAQVLEVIRSGIVGARRYGVELCYDVTRFVEYMIQYGPDFDSDAETAWAGAILRLPDLSGTEKMDRIDAGGALCGRGALA
jgi:hypothetical protein